MHRYKIIAQFSLILSILNLVLAAPIVVQEIHEARDDEPEKSKSTSPQSPQHSPSSSLDGSTSSGHPTAHYSPGSSGSEYSWWLDGPAPNPPASLHEPASLSPSSSGPSEELAPEMPPSPNLPASLHGSTSPHPSSPGSPEIIFPPPFVLEEIPPSPPAVWGQGMHPLHYPSSSGSSQLSGSGQSEIYSPQGEFTPSHHTSSLSSMDWYSEESTSTPHSQASGGSRSSHNFPASDGSVPSHHSESMSEGSVPSDHSGSVPEGLVPSDHSESMSEGLVPSDHLRSDGSPHSPSSPPTETLPDKAKFFNENMMKKLKIVTGLAIVGGVIGGAVGLHIKHKDSQDS